jgi:hypothetical protein
MKAGNLTIEDCLFTGTVNGSGSYNGCFIGYIDSGSATITNSLSTGTFSYSGESNGFRGTYTNCYVKQFPTDYPSGVTKPTDEELADGTVAYRLQAGRTDMFWGQRIGTDTEPVMTNDESYRVYRSINGGYTNDPTLAYEGLQKDVNDNYLLGCVWAWQDFATLVNGGSTNINAKMTADIDLDDDQTMVGTDSKKYKGTFDGQSHSLTIHYVTTNEVTAPFRYIDGATIKNLHVKGSINATQKHVGGFVANAYNGTCNIINCWSSIDLICNGNSSTGGFVGYAGGGTVILNIEDSYFDGSFTVVNALYCGGVVGRKFLNNSVKIYIRNCLFNPNSVSVSYTNNDCNQPETFCSNESVSYIATISNCYYTVRLGNSTQGTIASTEHLSDGTVAYKLQADRTDMFWGQRIGIDTKPVQTNDASYRVYRSKNGGYTNDPTLAYKGLQQDADDNYYLIGSLFDWQEFADLVKTTPTANAKMTADINLGDDQTMIGSESTPYQGTFDGQGHKLTVVYSEPSSSSQHVAPFIKIKNATIQNLHVSGSITTAGMRPASITSYVSGTCYVRNCWSDVAITSSYNADICAGGLVTRIDASQTLNMDDCKFSGSITLSNNSGYRAGGLIGWTQDKGIANVTNCLFAPSALSTIKSSADNKMLVSGYQGKVTITNCYYNTVGASSNWVVQGTAATDAELSNGTTTTALNNGRSEVIWVQDPVANQPMLAIFPAVMLGDVNGDHNIDENDLDVIVKIVMGETPPGIQKQAGDLNNDGKVDAADVVKMVDILNSRQDGGHPQ